MTQFNLGDILAMISFIPFSQIASTSNLKVVWVKRCWICWDETERQCKNASNLEMFTNASAVNCSWDIEGIILVSLGWTCRCLWLINRDVEIADQRRGKQEHERERIEIDWRENIENKVESCGFKRWRVLRHTVKSPHSVNYVDIYFSVSQWGPWLWWCEPF